MWPVQGPIGGEAPLPSRPSAEAVDAEVVSNMPQLGLEALCVLAPGVAILLPRVAELRGPENPDCPLALAVMDAGRRIGPPSSWRFLISRGPAFRPSSLDTAEAERGVGLRLMVAGHAARRQAREAGHESGRIHRKQSKDNNTNQPPTLYSSIVASYYITWGLLISVERTTGSLF